MGGMLTGGLLTAEAFGCISTSSANAALESTVKTDIVLTCGALSGAAIGRGIFDARSSVHIQ